MQAGEVPPAWFYLERKIEQKMIGAYNVNGSEMATLLVFSGIEEWSTFEELIMSEKELFEVVRKGKESLVKKGYICTDKNEKYYLPNPLNIIMSLIHNFHASFFIENNISASNKTIIYFKYDAIVLVDKKENEYELRWIPFLSHLMTAIEKKIECVWNEKTMDIQECSFDEGNRLRMDCLEKTKGNTEWKFIGKETDQEEKDFLMYLIENDNELTAFQIWNNQMLVYKPTKADGINTLEKWLRKAHGNAMKEGKEINGSV